MSERKTWSQLSWPSKIFAIGFFATALMAMLVPFLLFALLVKAVF